MSLRNFMWSFISNYHIYEYICPQKEGECFATYALPMKDETMWHMQMTEWKGAKNEKALVGRIVRMHGIWTTCDDERYANKR